MTPLYQIYTDDKKNNIYIKREDLIPFSFGGNKARKAVKFFDEIDSGNYDAVVTYGSSSSNHCRVVANMAAKRGMKCCIIGPNEASEETYNSKMMKLFNAEITIVPVEEVSKTIEKKLQQLKDEGYYPYFIAGGGHGNLGTEAYVECYEEIKEYEKAQNIKFDYIFFASGTGTTQAGLVCGQIINRDEKQIVGISIARKNPRGRAVVLDSIEEYLREKQFTYCTDTIEEKTIFDDSYTGDGYAKSKEKIECIIRKILVNYGVPMDSTYTAKAYVGMEDYIEKNEIENQNILFIHTGGTPLFFDEFKE